MRTFSSVLALAAALVAPFARINGGNTDNPGVIHAIPDSLIGNAPDTLSGAEAYTAAVCAAVESAAADSTDRYTRLTIADYERVAAELGVEVATIRAVSDIEAGKSHKGFFAPGKPVINFDRSIFASRLRRAGRNVARARKKHPVAFAKLNIARYGNYGEAQLARLNEGIAIDNDIAKESTFWGMFQIGGFNWRRCQVESVDEFARLMSESEAMQLELFARFIKSNGMVDHLKKKNWSAFARAYNGAGYARKGYHRRLAAAYAKYSKSK